MRVQGHAGSEPLPPEGLDCPEWNVVEVRVFGTLCINQSFVLQYTSQDCHYARTILIGRVLASHWSNKGLKGLESDPNGAELQ